MAFCICGLQHAVYKHVLLKNYICCSFQLQPGYGGKKGGSELV